MAISDADYNRIKDNLPRVGIKGYIDSDQQNRTGLAFLAIDLLRRFHLHVSWAISFPTVEQLALAQDGLVNFDAGPTEIINTIHNLLSRAMFLPGGQADWRILAMLDAAGFKVIRDFTNTDDDAFMIRTIRGHFAIYPPEV